MRLKCEATPSIKLVVAVLGDPDVVLRKEGALGLSGVWVGEEELCWGRDEFVCYVFAADGVCLGRVGDFDGAVVLGFGVETGGCLDRGARDVVEIAPRVGICVDGCCVGFFDYDGVGVPVYGRVDAKAEDVLVILGKGTRGNDRAIVAGFVGVDVDDANDASSASFNGKACGEVEFVVEDVLVVG